MYLAPPAWAAGSGRHECASAAARPGGYCARPPEARPRCAGPLLPATPDQAPPCCGAGHCPRSPPRRMRPAAHSPCRWPTTAPRADACAAPSVGSLCWGAAAAALARGPRTAFPLGRQLVWASPSAPMGRHDSHSLQHAPTKIRPHPSQHCHSQGAVTRGQNGIFAPGNIRHGGLAFCPGSDAGMHEGLKSGLPWHETRRWLLRQHALEQPGKSW